MKCAEYSKVLRKNEIKRAHPSQKTEHVLYLKTSCNAQFAHCSGAQTTDSQYSHADT